MFSAPHNSANSLLGDKAEQLAAEEKWKSAIRYTKYFWKML